MCPTPFFTACVFGVCAECDGLLALMNPLQAKASSKRKYDGDMYSLPRLNKDPSASRSVHPVASRKNGNNNLADMLDNEVAQRLAPKHKLGRQYFLS